MRNWSKFWLIPALALALLACSLVSQIHPTPGNLPQDVTPSIPITATTMPLAATTAPAPPISSLTMIDAQDGWAWTSAGRLLHTADGGATWMDRSPEGQIRSDGFFPLDGQTAWLPIYLEASSSFGLMHTSDGGQTWLEYPSGPASGLHFSDALNGWAVTGDVGAGNIYYSLSETRDGGKTWTPIPVKPPTVEEGLPPGTIHLCNICNDSFYYDPSRMIIVDGDMGSMEARGSIHMQVSFDLGTTWQTKNLPLPKNSTDALVSPYQPVFLGGEDGLLPVSLVKMNSDGSFGYQRLAFYATRDGGASWWPPVGGLENIGPFAQIRIVSSQDIYVLCGNVLCASHDGAQTWQTLASSLDFSQDDKRSVWLLDFLNATTGWASIIENENTTLYQTADGGETWTQLAPRLSATVPPTIRVVTDIPTATLVPTPTPEPTSTPKVTFDQNANAYRVRFAPGGTWVEINDTISANNPKRYILSAMQGQVMSISIPQGPAFSVQVTGADKKPLDDTLYSLPFWRGVLPSTQDYIVSVEPQVSGPFTLRIAIDPPGQATQSFGFTDHHYLVSLIYSDEFAPTDVQIPVNPKGTPLLTLAFIDSAFYSPRTNLSEAYLLLAASSDPTVTSTCTQPSAEIPETVTGQVSINNQSFTRSEFSGAAAGNRYDQVTYRSVWHGKCIEVIFLIHSTNIGNYSPGTVVEYDQAALLGKFEAVLNTIQVK